jgi:Fe-S cluster biogenesis protein NfuA
MIGWASPQVGALDEKMIELVTKALLELAVPLVKADGGEVYLVSVTSEDVHVHLTGTCAGCPGASMTRERLFEPTVHGVSPKLNVKLTTGWNVPEGARKID